MTDETRRRRISSAIKPELQKPILSVEERAESSSTTEESGRRRRRIHSVIKPEEEKPLLPAEESLTNTAIKRDETDPFTTRQGINEIRSELMEERNSSLIESNYWDETHSWGSDDDEASDEYWHFVGRYE